MTDDWNELIHGARWRSPAVLWVEDGTEYSWRQVDDLASAIQAAIADPARARGAVRVVHVRCDAKLGCFAGQLAAWRAGCVAVADDGRLGQPELDRVRADLTVTLTTEPGRIPAVESARRSDTRLPADRIPGEVVAVNFTSGSTGSRRAAGVTRGNLLTLFDCPGLRVPADGAPVSGSFATPTYDGWWFDTWRAVRAGGTVVCMPSVNEDVFAWPELTERYCISSLLLPAAVIATVIGAVPESIAGIPWLFSGGEQFQVSTYQQARQAGLTSQFVNLYGPTEATFASHRYVLPEFLDTDTIPIGTPLDGCEQSLRALDGHAADRGELVISGPVVCLGYIDEGVLTHRFRAEDGRPSYRTGDVVRVAEDGNLVFAGRLDSQIKVNGIRVDAAALEHQVAGLPDVLDCRVVQDGRHTVAFVRADPRTAHDLAAQSRIESVVKRFSPAIGVRVLDRFPTKSGGKVDTACLMDHHLLTEKGKI